MGDELTHFVGIEMVSTWHVSDAIETMFVYDCKIIVNICDDDDNNTVE